MWLRTHPEFLEIYGRAKEESANAHAEDILDIADNAAGDVKRDRLRIDARKWILAKLSPKKYGDRIELRHAGASGGAVVHKIELTDLTAESGTARADEQHEGAAT